MRRRCYRPVRSWASAWCRGRRSGKDSSPERSAPARSSRARISAAASRGFTAEALEANQPVVDLVVDIAGRRRVTPAQVALGWLLAKSPNVVPIPGSRNLDRVQENAAAAQVRLTPDEIDEIDRRSAALTVTGARGSGHESYR
nr:aldo/keto reductase [Microlunatus elymi]